MVKHKHSRTLPLWESCFEKCFLFQGSHKSGRVAGPLDSPNSEAACLFPALEERLHGYMSSRDCQWSLLNKIRIPCYQFFNQQGTSFIRSSAIKTTNNKETNPYKTIANRSSSNNWLAGFWSIWWSFLIKCHSLPGFQIILYLLLFHAASFTWRPWCWERLKAGGEGDNGGWDGWMTSQTQ